MTNSKRLEYWQRAAEQSWKDADVHRENADTYWAMRCHWHTAYEEEYQQKLNAKKEVRELKAEIELHHKVIDELEKDNNIIRDLITKYKEEIKERQRWNGLTGDELDELLEDMYADQLSQLEVAAG